jgi:hypothetical protein
VVVVFQFWQRLRARYQNCPAWIAAITQAIGMLMLHLGLRATLM